MQPTTSVWSGWIGALPDNGAQYRLTWEQWRALQRQRLEQEPSRDAFPPHVGEREVATRAFLVWFDATAGSGRQDPPFDDRELAVRGFMHDLAEVTAMHS